MRRECCQWLARKKAETIETPEKEKERYYSIRLLGTSSLKEGEMWRAA
jgi:hypothetical protein